MDSLFSLVSDDKWITAVAGLIGVLLTAYLAKGKAQTKPKPTPVNNAPLSVVTCGWSEEERVMLRALSQKVDALTTEIAIVKDRLQRN